MTLQQTLPHPPPDTTDPRLSRSGIAWIVLGVLGLMAATLLGASWPQRFRTIILPKMKTIVIIALAIRVIENFKIFDTLYIMTGGGPGVATETISVYIYKVTQNDLIWGYVAAIALAILIFLSIVANFAIARMNRARAGGAA